MCDVLSAVRRCGAGEIDSAPIWRSYSMNLALISSDPYVLCFDYNAIPPTPLQSLTDWNNCSVGVAEGEKAKKSQKKSETETERVFSTLSIELDDGKTTKCLHDHIMNTKACIFNQHVTTAYSIHSASWHTSI